MPKKLFLAVPLTALAILTGCGGDDETTSTSAASSEAGAGSEGAELAAVKAYLTDHSAELAEQTAILKEVADEYYDLAEAADFDYAALMKQNGEEVQAILEEAKEAFVAANPAYEEMEGIVAGVPRLAQYDVDIDAGADASDPENAVSFSLELPNGETLKQPGNLFFVTETALYGTNPDFLAEGVEQDVDGDGKVEFGEGMPDADIYVARVREFEEQAENLRRRRPGVRADAVGRVHRDHGDDADDERVLRGVEELALHRRREAERARLRRDLAPLGHRRHPQGILFTYDEIEPPIAGRGPAAGRADRPGSSTDLLAFVEDLRDREADGKKFTAEEADTLGSEAQRQAEAIAGQVTQAAQQLGIELQEARTMRAARPARSRGGAARSRSSLRARARAAPGGRRDRGGGRGQPPWQAAEQIRNALFDARSATCCSTAVRAPARRRPRRAARVAASSSASSQRRRPGELRELRAALADAEQRRRRRATRSGSPPPGAAPSPRFAAAPSTSPSTRPPAATSSAPAPGS